MLGKLIIVALALVVPALGHTLPYIVGGGPVASDTQHPWQGGIYKSGSLHCGCALISSTWAVTSANQVGTTPSDLLIRFGSLFHHEGGLTRTPTMIIRHGHYGIGSGNLPNDIAVMSFSAVTLGSTVSAIKMASSEAAGNSDCWITGWGETTYPDSEIEPLQLQEAHVNVYTNSECINTWGSSINDGHVCAGDSVEGKVACHGDFGGPLVCESEGAYQLVGVHSWGFCDTVKPVVYTRISYFRAWVTLKTGVQ